jgi:hypothetical protein
MVDACAARWPVGPLARRDVSGGRLEIGDRDFPGSFSGSAHWGCNWLS